MADLPAETPSSPESPLPEQEHCSNCGAPLHGHYCHVCGQSTRHVLKHLPALLEDGLDLVFNIDGRIMHTIPALYLRPGFLAREYFAGRRARYIPPFRLMFFLSALAFLLMRLNLSMGNQFANTTVNFRGETPAQIRAHLQKTEKQLARARNQPDMPAISRAALDVSAGEIRAQANRRLQALGAAPVASASTTTTPTAVGKSAQAQTYMSAIRQAQDDKQVQKRLQVARAEIDASRKLHPLTPATRKQLDALDNELVAAAKRRTAELAGKAKPADTQTTTTITFGPALAAGASSSSDNHLLHTLSKLHVDIHWLPAFVNRWINTRIDNARANMKALASETHQARNDAGRRLGRKIMSMLPQTLFLMLPLFALLLKIFYLFRRRLYIEHLMVAMYSHAFIFMSLLLWALVGLVRLASPAWLSALLGWLELAIFLWIPVYLFLMQKRVYAQGWFLTSLKYTVVGVCYTVLVALAVAGAAVAGLTS